MVLQAARWRKLSSIEYSFSLGGEEAVFTWDKEHNFGYLDLTGSSDVKALETVEVGGCPIDLSEDGTIIGIEFLSLESLPPVLVSLLEQEFQGSKSLIDELKGQGVL